MLLRFKYIIYFHRYALTTNKLHARGQLNHRMASAVPASKALQIMPAYTLEPALK